MMKLNKKEAKVYVEHVKKDLHIKYGKRYFLSLDLTEIIYNYFNSENEAVPMTQIKNIFKGGGVDLEVLVHTEPDEEIYIKK